MKKKIKIFLTGSTGFVGYNFLKIVNPREYEILRPSKKKLNLKNFKRVQEYLKANNPDIILNLASYTNSKTRSKFEDYRQFNNTIIPIINLCKASDENLKLFIGVGSIEEYGNCFAPFKENSKPKPISSYGIAKYKSYLQFKKICKRKKIRNIWLRPSLMFGNKMKSGRLMQNIIVSYKKNKKMTINNPLSIRDHLYVGDFCRILILIIKKYKNFNNNVYNVTSENWMSNKNLVKKISKIAGNNYNILFDISSKNVDINFYNSGSKLRKMIKSFKFTSFKKGLIETFKFNNLNLS